MIQNKTIIIKNKVIKPNEVKQIFSKKKKYFHAWAQNTHSYQFYSVG